MHRAIRYKTHVYTYTRANINTTATSYGNFSTSVCNGEFSSPRGNSRLIRLNTRANAGSPVVVVIVVMDALAVTLYNPVVIQSKQVRRIYREIQASPQRLRTFEACANLALDRAFISLLLSRIKSDDSAFNVCQSRSSLILVFETRRSHLSLSRSFSKRQYPIHRSDRIP